MKKSLYYVLCSVLVLLMMTGCTRYASASPTPENTQAATLGIATPTLMALEVQVSTRTPIPLVLKTATPTSSISDILTATVEEGEMETKAPGTQEGEVQKTPGLVTPKAQITMFGKTPTVSGTRTTSTPGAGAFPTRAPIVVLAGKPTVAIVHVKYADSITVRISNLDPNSEYKLQMGSAGAYGTDGPVVGTAKSDKNGVIENTYKIPEAYLGFGQIAFRIEFPDGKATSFYFYNNDY